MASEKWSIEEVRNKIEWEGGILDTLFWGLRADIIADEELSSLWAELEKIEPLIRRIEAIIYE
jgi:hypothetical protein